MKLRFRLLILCAGGRSGDTVHRGSTVERPLFEYRNTRFIAADRLKLPRSSRMSENKVVGLSRAISKRNLILLMWLALATLMPYPSLAEEKCGVIIGLTGRWMFLTRELTLGERVPAGQPQPTPPTDGTLTVWFQSHRPIFLCQGKSCGNTKSTDTSNPPEWPKSCPPPQKDSFWTSLFSEAPSRYFTAASRGLEGDLKEVVVPLTRPEVDLAPAMTDLSAGVYWVRFEALGGDVFRTAPTQLEWPSKQALVSAAGLKPGLYRLVLVDESGEPTGAESWILLCDTQDCSRTSAMFQDIVHTVSTWPANTDPAAIRAVLRASLDALAKQEKDPANHP
jgi:hypothetical protein